MTTINHQCQGQQYQNPQESLLFAQLGLVCQTCSVYITVCISIERSNRSIVLHWQIPTTDYFCKCYSSSQCFSIPVVQFQSTDILLLAFLFRQSIFAHRQGEKFVRLFHFFSTHFSLSFSFCMNYF